MPQSGQSSSPADAAARQRRNAILAGVSALAIVAAGALLWLRSGGDPAINPASQAEAQKVVDKLQAEQNKTPQAPEPAPPNPVERGARRKPTKATP